MTDGKEEKKVVTPPTKTIPMEEFYSSAVTDNANNLMDRVWYCIACTNKDVGDQKVFWEHWYWKNEEEKAKGEFFSSSGASPPKKLACNHTLTIAAKDDKEIDYPIWPLVFTKESFKMYPAIDLKCAVIAPIGLSVVSVTFPTEGNSRTEFRVDYCQAMGAKMYFVFVLDPHISENDKKKNFDILETEHGVLREWFYDVQWDENYVVGSTGEPDINPK